MTNYIHRLQDENAALTRELEALRAGLADLRGYLNSPKFGADTTVQVGDVLARLADADSRAVRAHDVDSIEITCPHCQRYLGEFDAGTREMELEAHIEDDCDDAAARASLRLRRMNRIV